MSNAQETTGRKPPEAIVAGPFTIRLDYGWTGEPVAHIFPGPHHDDPPRPPFTINGWAQVVALRDALNGLGPAPEIDPDDDVPPF